MKRKISPILVICVLVVSMFLGFSSLLVLEVKATSNPPPSGDWIIGPGEIVIKSDDSFILDGNLIIMGTLIFEREVVLTMASTFNGEYRIDVRPGGSFDISNNSMIRAQDEDFYYRFLVSGSLNMSTDSALVQNEIYHLAASPTDPARGGIQLLPGSTADIQNTTIQFSEGPGIDVRTSNIVRITGCTIRNNVGAGINITHSAPTLTDISIENCIINDNGYGGIISERMIGGTIKGCLIKNPGEERRCIQLVDTHSTIIVNNDIHGGNYSNSIGVWVSGSSNILIDNNQIRYNGGSGIYVNSSEYISITNNPNIYYNGRNYGWTPNVFLPTGAGIFLLDDCNNITIENNNIEQNDRGVESYSHYIYIINNIIHNNQYTGLSINEVASDSKHTEIIGNQFIDNRGTCEVSIYQSSAIFNKNIIERKSVSYQRLLRIVDSYLYGTNNTIEGFSSSGNSVQIGESWGADDTSVVTLLNTTIDKPIIWVQEGGSLTRQWFVNSRVINEVGEPVQDAAIFLRDNQNGTDEIVRNTDSNGWANWTICTEYIQNGSEITDFTPHTLHAEKEGVGEYMKYITIDDFVQWDNITLRQLIAPHNVAIQKTESVRDCNRVHLTWDSNNAEHYRVFRSTNRFLPLGDWEQISGQLQNNYFEHEADFSAHDTYYYIVRSYNGDLASDPSTMAAFHQFEFTYTPVGYDNWISMPIFLPDGSGYKNASDIVLDRSGAGTAALISRWNPAPGSPFNLAGIRPLSRGMWPGRSSFTPKISITTLA